jgi:hypothetical protein
MLYLLAVRIPVITNPTICAIMVEQFTLIDAAQVFGPGDTEIKG